MCFAPRFCSCPWIFFMQLRPPRKDAAVTPQAGAPTILSNISMSLLISGEGKRRATQPSKSFQSNGRACDDF